MKLRKGYWVLIIPAVIIVTAVVFLFITGLTPKETIITGIVETTEIDIASKLPGRIDTIYVREGDNVKKGDVLAHLESKEMDAKVEQARGVMEAARAKMQMAHNGARIEEKEGAEKLYLQAKHQYEYASKTWERFQSLYKDSVISTQEKDEIEFKYKASKEQMDAAKSRYDMAMKGARVEEISAADALFHQAENAFNEAMAYYQELTIKAPETGEVSNRIVDPGEVIAAGYPIFTIMNQNDDYIVLQIREDMMNNIRKGKILTGNIPALGNIQTDFEVTYIAPMADFATWKPTNQKGEFDLKTFEIHLRTKTPVDGLRPGMTANIKL